jgi:hypothetical protein
MWALTAVAPIVRFNALDIFETPALLRASDFSSRTSDKVHARLTNFFFFHFDFGSRLSERGF